MSEIIFKACDIGQINKGNLDAGVMQFLIRKEFQN